METSNEGPGPYLKSDEKLRSWGVETTTKEFLQDSDRWLSRHVREGLLVKIMGKLKERIVIGRLEGLSNFLTRELLKVPLYDRRLGESLRRGEHMVVISEESITFGQEMYSYITSAGQTPLTSIYHCKRCGPVTGRPKTKERSVVGYKTYCIAKDCGKEVGFIDLMPTKILTA